jgi:hypothetical protein
MIYYKTSIFTYKEFLKENNTDRLSKTEKIKSESNITKYLNMKKLNEIFDKEIEDLEYETEVYKHPEYDDEENITYLFNSEKNNKYRLDLVILKEYNENLKDIRLHNKKFISVSFSKSDSTIELYDLMSRIRYLIKLNEYKTEHGYVFMFGKPSENKINMYEYFIKVCFPDYKLIKDYSSVIEHIKIGYYLIRE